MKELRDYQTEISVRGAKILNKLNIVYLAMAVRTGKSATSLNIAKLSKFKKVLFLTKKRAIRSIEEDYKDFGFDKCFKLKVINNESAHKFIDDYDLIISDEHHRNGAFPKPNNITKLIKHNYSNLPMIFLSGTPHPESYSQIFHQFWCSDHSPFYPNVSFYKWAKLFVNIKDRHLGYAVVKDYSDANYNLFKNLISPYFITFTQKEAGFETEVKENIIKVKMNPLTYQLANKLKKNKFIIAKDGSEIMADTAVKEMQKLHQIYSGTVLFEDGTNRIFDFSKVEFIKNHFKDYKIAIFYKFKAEYEALKEVLGNKLTNDLEEFNTTSKWIALQIVSGSEGISLKEADYLVYYNIDFSSKNYWQSRDRLTTMKRKSNDVYWLFAEDGIEEKIYQKVLDKKNYTLSVFKKDFK